MTATEFKTHIIPLYGPMRSVARRYLTEEDGEDIVQDVLRKLWENRSELNIKTNLPAYVLRTIRNKCLDYLRTTVKIVPLNEAEGDYREEEEIIELDRFERLNRALNLLDIQKRTILELSLSGVKSEEIARRFSLSPVNVRQILSRTRQELKRLMKKKN